MNLELIEAAATVYAKETWNHEEDQFMCIDGFKEGAKWAQKEFVNSLWHDASEEPEKFKPCLVYGVFTYEGGRTNRGLLYIRIHQLWMDGRLFPTRL